MAVYKLSSNKKSNKHNVKKIVGFSLIVAASVLFFFLTGIVGVFQTFALGIFGVFGFPLSIAMFIIGLALVNNRKYVMSVKYTVCLCLAIFFALCILQLAIVGSGKNVTFGDYLAKNYLNKWTAGGILIGFFTTILLYAASVYGAYIISCAGLIICVALLLDSLNFLKKEKKEDEPISLQIKEQKKVSENQTLSRIQEQAKESQNVVLAGNLKEEEKKEQPKIEPPKPKTAKQILGLDRKRNYAYEFENKPEVRTAEKQEVEKQEPEKPKSLREQILTPPKINLDEYFKDIRNQPPQNSEVQENVSALKEPEPIYHEDEFKPDTQPLIRRPLPEVKAEELVNVADSILQEAIQEEKDENPEIYENPLDNLPERDNGGNFSSRGENTRENFSRDDFSRDNFSRDNFSRENDAENFDESEEGEDEGESQQPSQQPREFGRDFGRDRGDFSRDRETFRQSVNDNFERNNHSASSFEDRDARNEFTRNMDTISARNGSQLREQMRLEPEEEPEVEEPYVYEKPPIDFITTQSVDLSTLNRDVEQKRVLLEDTLGTFGVPAKVQGVIVGPAVTRYELEMPQGVSVSKIKNRADDIALYLAAEGSIRIEAPVPGKSVVGIEVPNSSIATISLKDVLVSKEFTQNPSPLTFAIGKDITGQTICGNMQKLTHLLVAGSTGSGKSVCLNSIILSIIYKASPEEVKIILIDPKRVEFSSYEALPHLIMPKIVCDTQKAINTLGWAVGEMERRFEVLGQARVKNIDEFNQSPDVLAGKVKKMPFIVIIVDELADLMMTGKKEVEEKVCRLAQKSRAAGIHLILATQRPSVDVITGLIKSNFPSRIAFAVTSAVDSMTILDRVGAEKLLGKGDMLYYPIGAQEPRRVQGCFVTTNETNKIVDYVRDNNKPIFDREIEQQIENPNKGNGNGNSTYNTDMDELLPQALKASIDCGQASATMIRRRFAIGYPRAARIIDQMEAGGYISSADGPKGRTVYITREEFEQLFGDVD